MTWAAVEAGADGTPDYLVRCHSFSSEPEEQAEIKCRLYLNFGIWPVTVQISGIAPKDWDDLSERVQKFLTSVCHRRDSPSRVCLDGPAAAVGADAQTAPATR